MKISRSQLVRDRLRSPHPAQPDEHSNPYLKMLLGLEGKGCWRTLSYYHPFTVTFARWKVRVARLGLCLVHAAHALRPTTIDERATLALLGRRHGEIERRWQEFGEHVAHEVAHLHLSAGQPA